MTSHFWWRHQVWGVVKENSCHSYVHGDNLLISWTNIILTRVVRLMEYHWYSMSENPAIPFQTSFPVKYAKFTSRRKRPFFGENVVNAKPHEIRPVQTRVSNLLKYQFSQRSDFCKCVFQRREPSMAIASSESFRVKNDVFCVSATWTCVYSIWNVNPCIFLIAKAQYCQCSKDAACGWRHN